MRLLAALLVLALSPAVAATMPPAIAPADATAPAEERRFDGSSAEALAESRTAFEADMGDAAKLAFHMKLAQVRAKLAEQRGRPLTDAEFAAALDGKSLAEFEAMAEAAPTQITIDIETSDDT